LEVRVFAIQWTDMEEQKTEGHEDGPSMQSDTQHEPHEHARPRLMIGIGAVILVLIIGFFIWSKWGADIKEACLGDGDACTVELPNTPSEGGVDFNESYAE